MELPALLNRRDIKEYLQKSFAITDALISHPDFPDPVLISGKTRYWARPGIDHFLTYYGQKIQVQGPGMNTEKEAERILLEALEKGGMNGNR